MIEIQVKKAEQAYEFDFVNLPEAAKEFVIEYGLRQIMNDSVSSAKTQAEAEGMAGKKYDALLSGTLRAVRSATPADPIGAEAQAIAKGIVKASQAWATLRAKTEDKEERKAWFAAKVAEVAGMDQVRAQAEMNIASVKDLAIEI